MNPTRSLLVLALACAACSQDPMALPERGMSPGKPQAPVEARVVEAPELQVGVPAQLLLDVRTGIPTDGVEVTVEGDAGLTVVDYAPKLLPASDPASGHQVLVDVIPVSGGTRQLTARLVLHVGGERPTRPMTLPLAVTGPETVLPVADKPVVPTVRDAAGELVRPLPAETTVHDGK